MSYDQGQKSTDLFSEIDDFQEFIIKPKVARFEKIEREVKWETGAELQIDYDNLKHIPQSALIQAPSMPFFVEEIFQIREPFRFEQMKRDDNLHRRLNRLKNEPVTRKTSEITGAEIIRFHEGLSAEPIVRFGSYNEKPKREQQWIRAAELLYNYFPGVFENMGAYIRSPQYSYAVLRQRVSQGAAVLFDKEYSIFGLKDTQILADFIVQREGELQSELSDLHNKVVVEIVERLSQWMEANPKAVISKTNAYLFHLLLPDGMIVHSGKGASVLSKLSMIYRQSRFLPVNTQEQKDREQLNEILKREEGERILEDLNNVPEDYKAPEMISNKTVIISHPSGLERLSVSFQKALSDFLRTGEGYKPPVLAEDELQVLNDYYSTIMNYAWGRPGGLQDRYIDRLYLKPLMEVVKKCTAELKKMNTKYLGLSNLEVMVLKVVLKLPADASLPLQCLYMPPLDILKSEGVYDRLRLVTQAMEFINQDKDLATILAEYQNEPPGLLTLINEYYTKVRQKQFAGEEQQDRLDAMPQNTLEIINAVKRLYNQENIDGRGLSEEVYTAAMGIYTKYQSMLERNIPGRSTTDPINWQDEEIGGTLREILESVIQNLRENPHRDVIPADQADEVRFDRLDDMDVDEVKALDNLQPAADAGGGAIDNLQKEEEEQKEEPLPINNDEKKLDFLTEIAQGVQLKKRRRNDEAEAPAALDLLAQIRQGVQLKPTPEAVVKTEEQKESVAEMLVQLISNRRHFLQQEDSDNDSDGSW